MFAIAKTHTDHHPRGSGPAYGSQFEKIANAYHALKSHTATGPIQLIMMVDVDVETDLFVPVTDTQVRHVAVELQDQLPVEYQPGSGMRVGPADVACADVAVRTWWNEWGRFDTSPWDPNGIATARRLGLERGKPSEHFDFGHDVETFDDYCFKAFDRGDYDKLPWSEIWNAASKASGAGWGWSRN